MIFTGLVTILAFLFCIFLSGLSLLRYGAVDFTVFSEKITLVRQSGAAVAIGLFGAVLVSVFLQCFLFSRSETEKKKIYRRTGAVSFCLIFLLGFFWIHTNPCPPIADPLVVWDSARCLAAGITDTPEFSFYATYLQTYPFQKGLILFCAGLIRLFGAHPQHSFQLLNVLCAGLIVLLLARIARNLARDSAAGILVHLLGLLFAPLVLFTPFVYGTLVSYTCLLAGFDAALVLRSILPSLPLMGKARWRCLYFFPAVVLPALACQLYTSAWIGVTAIVLFFLISAFLQYAKKLRGIVPLIALAILVPLLTLSLQDAVQEGFLRLTGLPAGGGTPASTYLYMGISSTNGVAGPGSHNGSDIGMFTDNGMDPDATDDEARAAIRETMDAYASGRLSYSFFVEKAEYQWLDPWFSSVQLTIHPDMIPDTAPPRFTFLLESGLLPALEKMLSVLLPVIYRVFKLV